DRDDAADATRRAPLRPSVVGGAPADADAGAVHPHLLRRLDSPAARGARAPRPPTPWPRRTTRARARRPIGGGSGLAGAPFLDPPGLGTRYVGRTRCFSGRSIEERRAAPLVVPVLPSQHPQHQRAHPRSDRTDRRATTASATQPTLELIHVAHREGRDVQR